MFSPWDEKVDDNFCELTGKGLKLVNFDIFQSVNVHQIKDGRNGVVNNQIQDWSFRLDGIFHNSTQDQVFDTVSSNIVTSALDGYNGECHICFHLLQVLYHTDI